MDPLFSRFQSAVEAAGAAEGVPFLFSTPDENDRRLEYYTLIWWQGGTARKDHECRVCKGWWDGGSLLWRPAERAADVESRWRVCEDCVDSLTVARFDFGRSWSLMHTDSAESRSGCLGSLFGNRLNELPESYGGELGGQGFTWKKYRRAGDVLYVRNLRRVQSRLKRVVKQEQADGPEETEVREFFEALNALNLASEEFDRKDKARRSR